MVEELRLLLLGGLHLIRCGTPVTGFVSSKVPALLSYLAVTGRPHLRAALAGLLWGELADAAANANLRQALSNLRRLLAPHLIITPQTVEFNRANPYWLDVEVLNSRSSPRATWTDTDISLLGEAIELYQGEFLQGFHVRNAPAFEEWVLGQREHWRQIVLQALHTLAAHYTAQDKCAEAIRYTTRLLDLEPWQEQAHRQMMQLLARSGRREAALAQYETCRRVLAQELGIEPMPETNALVERIRAAGSTRPHNLPAPTTSFVGREDELAQVARLLAEPTCRLLTITGPGGIGKTRLALQAALRASAGTSVAFCHGVYLVPLASVSSMELLVTTLAQSVGVSLHPGADPRVLLLNHLRDKEMLLLLDGFEHLTSEAGLVSDILQNAPQVKLLVTSRQRLNLQGEWLLELGGLAYPTRPLTSERLQEFSAVQLFIQRARQVRPHWQFSEADARAIVRICQWVDGMPLGLELAAAWVQMLPCADIAREIERSLDALSTRLHDRPEQHQSMRAVFQHSWNLLSEAERRTLRRMAAFRGEFSREAAEQVTGADLSLLSALVDKSHLRVNAAGRYELHPLVHQFVEEKLAQSPPSEQNQVHERHGRYYASFVQQHEKQLQGLQQERALAEMDKEIENVRAAWRRAVVHRRLPELQQCLKGLALFYHTHGWLLEGESVMGLAAATFGGEDGVATDPLMTVVLGGALMGQGMFCVLLGQYEHASRLLQKSLSLLRSTDASWETVMAFAWLGLATMSQGDYQPAKAYLQESVKLAQASRDRWLIGTALASLGLCVRFQDYAEAAEYFQESVAMFKQAGDQHRMKISLLYLGEAVWPLGRLAEAKQYLDESLVFARQTHTSQMEAWSLANLGEVAYASGEYLEAQCCFREGLALAEQVGDNWVTVSCRAGLGSVALKQGDKAEAKEHFHIAFQRAVETQAWPHVVDLLVRRAEILAGQGEAQQERAVELVAQALHSPLVWQTARARAERLFAELRASLPPDTFTAAWQRGQARTLESTVGEALQGTT